MSPEEQLQQEQLINKLIENSAKDLKELQNIGEESGKKVKQDIINNQSTQKEYATVSTDSTTKVNSDGASIKISSILSILIMIVVISYTIRKKLKRNPSKLISKITDKLTGKINSKVTENKDIENGVVIGSLDNKLIVKTPKQSGNVLVVGAPGKGKSVNVIIPSLLNWKGSAVVVDIKREIYAYTHNVQEGKGKVIVFDPEQNGHGYDPIRECNTVDSCQFLARTLIPTPKGADPFWTGNAQNILAAACYEGNKEGKTLPEIAERILMTEAQVLVEELNSSKYKEVQLLSSSVRGTPDKTLGGIFTELKGKLILFATDPNIRQALSKSEWTAETLEEGATIYLRVSERQIETYKQVWNLIIVQIIRHLASRPEHKNPPILLLLDELARLGKVEGYTSALTTLRSKEVTIVTAIQSLAQLQEHYGKEVTRTIMDSNAYKLVLSAADNETQKVFSDLAGKSEVKKKSANYSLGGGGISEHKQWEERFRPESFAYLAKPIYYPPDGPAYEIDKAYWMNINSFVKLQKKYGGPQGFMTDEEILEHATLKNKCSESSIDLEKSSNTELPENTTKENKYDDLSKYLYNDDQEEEGGLEIELLEKKIK